MDATELDAFLTSERTCRVATVGADGAPHVTPLWFVWDGAALWLTSIVASQRWTDLQRDPRVSVGIDAGEDYMDLLGVEIRGVVAVVGDVPRSDAAVSELDVPEQLFADKYTGGTIVRDGRHAWLRIQPDTIVSWDFRKLTRGS